MIDTADHYVYPDAVVVCGQAEYLDEYLDESLDRLLNPTVVVEVISEIPLTEIYRGVEMRGSGSAV